jgi:hypothetical protein
MLTLAIWVSVSVSSIDGVDSIGYRVSTKRRYRSNPNRDFRRRLANDFIEVCNERKCEMPLLLTYYTAFILR